MSTWDELATDEAERRDRKDDDWCALHADELFRQGAAWQREQLLTDETVERAARAMIAAEYPGIPADEVWAKWAREDYALKEARAALTEAIGDE